MKANINSEHNSIELDFEGEKPAENVRELLKAYGFWWFGKGKVWCHTLAIDGDFFKVFVESRVRPLVEKKPTAQAITQTLAGMSAEERQAVLAQFM